MNLADFAWIGLAYVAGSLPTGYWIGRAHGVDLRAHGSGNIGATNAGRVLGRRWFWVVLGCDFLKALVPVVLARHVAAGALSAEARGLSAGVAAVVGHVFSLFMRLRGGKGVAAAAGAFCALAPLPAAIAFAAWFAAFKGSGFVSLASVVGAVALPAACWSLHAFTGVAVDRGVSWAATLVGALIVVRHRENLRRLLRGEESHDRGSL
jgi:glycerol-3-phosphate acyltransferase PlsY